MQTAQFQLHAAIEERHWWFVARRQILRDVIHAVVPPRQGATIVDVGCGTGANLAVLADEYDCVGIDTSADAIRLAEARFPNVRFVHGCAPRDLGTTIERASLVLLSDVLEHVADDFKLFSELMAALRPGGYLLVTVPADRALWSEHDELFGHYRRYDPQRLTQVWQGLPVRAVFVSPFNARLYPIVRAVRCYNRRRGRTGGEVGTDFRLPTPWLNAALTRTFAGEGRRLARLAHGRPVRSYRRGVSLIALLQRLPGEMLPRTKPEGVASDEFDPAAQLATAP